jgi:hypothetical protein
VSRKNNIRPASISEVEAIVYALIQSVGGVTPGSIGNWITLWTRTVSGGGNPGTQTAPSNTGVAAVALKAKASGLFLVEGSVVVSSNTLGDLVTLTLHGGQSAGAGTLAGTPALTPYGFAGTNATNAQSGTLSSDASGGAGLTFDGTGIGSLANTYVSSSNLYQRSTNAGDNLVYSFSGILGNATKDVKTPFTVGDTVCFGLTVTGTDVINFNQITLTATELAVG